MSENECAESNIAALQFGFRMGVDETLRAQRRMSDAALTVPDGSVDARLEVAHLIDSMIRSIRSNMPDGWALVPQDLCGVPLPSDPAQTCDRAFEHLPLPHTAGEHEWGGSE